MEKFAQNGGLINSKGKELVHEELIRQALESLLLLTEVAVVHVNGHRKGCSVEAVGNRLQVRLLNKLLWRKKLDSLF